jgi:hypothetical protein
MYIQVHTYIYAYKVCINKREETFKSQIFNTSIHNLSKKC